MSSLSESDKKLNGVSNEHNKKKVRKKERMVGEEKF